MSAAAARPAPASIATATARRATTFMERMLDAAPKSELCRS
jgi:hypothetical protein